MDLINKDIVPDFFIVGAPKAGTTALDAYLRKHPDVFMCRKEAHYFCTDFPGNVNFESFSDYQQVFDGVQEGQTIGEASVWYLYSEAAVREILAVNPEARFIAMLRDPVKTAQATHGELLLDLREDEPDFEKAWRLQAARRQGEYIPLNAREPKHLLYKDVCSWSPQIDRLLDVAPSGSVKIIIMEEFFEDPDRGYREVLDFLGVRNITLDTYPKVNESKRVKSLWLLKASRDIPRRYPGAMRMAKKIANTFGLRPGRTIDQYVRKGNITHKPRPRLSEEFREELMIEFRPDVERLEGILGRSLKQYWLKG
ncbi:sulfotransferase family protein [Vreelandella subglaciescola]|jgi:hypothetical protein|uniref:Sulfotransferase family protein n=1 Tax=Vreelandella subglaciescola TaxID=29571 RepID=A0A1M7HCQ9_9GAMM|nr:sulfotransferase [Halomonas subglaciescola]SHM25937.1 Sulfotransferase family protein [Halomonas subglaciescola]